MNTVKTVSIMLLLAGVLVTAGMGVSKGGEATQDKTAAKSSLNKSQNSQQERYKGVAHPARYVAQPGQAPSGQGYAAQPDSNDGKKHPVLSRQGAMFATVILLLSGK